MNYKLEHGKLVMQRGRAGRRVNYLCHPIKDTVRDLSLRLETRDEKSTSRPEHGIAIPGQKRQVIAGLSNPHRHAYDRKTHHSVTTYSLH